MNQGKRFEEDFYNSVKDIKDLSVDRLYDTTTGFAGHANICDFILYRQPWQYYLELKSTQSSSFDMGDIPKGKFRGFSRRQYEGLLKKSGIMGVTAGLLLEFRKEPEPEVWFVSIKTVKNFIDSGKKSFNLRDLYVASNCYPLKLRKKRTRIEVYIQDFIDNF